MQSTLTQYSVKTDELGFTHTRYNQYAGKYIIEATTVITYPKTGYKV